MVEEQKTQIGTLKALGYNKLQITSKYVLYASLACIIGSILGMSVGFVLLPKIVWKMYSMMYQIGDIQTSFNFEIGSFRFYFNSNKYSWRNNLCSNKRAYSNTCNTNET